MLNIQKTIAILTSMLYLIALATVVLTVQLSGYENLLQIMTKENGFFETISVLLLFIIFLYGIAYSIRSREILSRVAIFYILSFSLLAFLAGMEEISWGQHLFHFQSSDYFLEQNLQQETNFHNLIDATIFSAVIYFTIYTFLIFIPLYYKIFNTSLKRFKLLRYFDINPHAILVVIFASMFQIYFYDNIGTWADMITYFVTLLLFAYFLWLYPSTLWLKLHFAFILVATTLSLWSHEVYHFKNMQYEIRESFVVLSALLIFIELVKKEKAKVNLR